MSNSPLILPVFSIHGHLDTIEGRGGTKIVGYAHTRNVAENIITDPRFSKHTVWGALPNKDDNFYIRQETLVIHNTHETFFRTEDDEIRARALAKLTKEERRTLGL